MSTCVTRNRNTIREGNWRNNEIMIWKKLCIWNVYSYIFVRNKIVWFCLNPCYIVYLQNLLSFVSVTLTSIYRLRFLKIQAWTKHISKLKIKKYIYTHIVNKWTYIKAYVCSLLKRTHFRVSIFVVNYYYWYLLLFLHFCKETMISAKYVESVLLYKIYIIQFNPVSKFVVK